MGEGLKGAASRDCTPRPPPWAQSTHSSDKVRLPFQPQFPNLRGNSLTSQPAEGRRVVTYEGVEAGLRPTKPGAASDY